MGKTTQLSDGTTFKSIIGNFIDYLCNQYVSVQIMNDKLQEWYIKENTAYQNYIDKHGLNISKPDDSSASEAVSETESQMHLVPFEQIVEYDRHFNDVTSIFFIKEQFLQTQFVDMIAHYDIFLQGIIRKVYYLFPERLNNKKKEIFFEKISSLNSIEEFKKSFIEDIIDTLFRGSHYSQLDFLKDELDCDVKSRNKDVYCGFIEITERRNILTHSSGIIGDQYLNVCKERGAIPAGGKGQKLSVDVDYFKKSCDVLLKLAIVIGYWFWITRAKDERQQADDYIINTVNRLIRDGRSDVAVCILEYVLSQDAPKSKAIYIKRFHLYKLFALKDLNRMEEFEKGISEDWTEVNNSIKLKLLVLKEKYDDAIALFKKIKGNEEGVDKMIFSESVIYRDFIQKTEFRDAYQEIYGESFCFSRDSLYM